MGRQSLAAHERRLGRVFVTVAVAGALLSTLAWLAVEDVLGALVAAVLLGLAELLPARIRDGIWASLGSVVVLAAVLLGGPALGMCAAVGLLATWRAYPSQPWPRTRTLLTLFNVGQTALAAGAAGLAFVSVSAPVASVGDLGHWTVWVALLSAACVYTIVNHLLVGVAVHLNTGERLSSTLGGIVGASMVMQVLYAGIAILGAALWFGIGSWSLAFLVIPALVARQALLGYQREEEAYDRLVSALLKTIEVKDGYTAGHTDRVSKLCVEVARELGFDYAGLRGMRYAAKLHDVGKLNVPISIINKPGRLDADEFDLIKTHPDVGAEILAEVDFLSPAVDGIRHHHEKVDGTGYPAGLRGGDIPLVARIITVCDAFDAMTSTRSYREAGEVEDALAELRRCSGSQFDPEVVETLARVVQRLGWEPTRDQAAPKAGALP
jgi:putative nucleotidyltransferase with HDIG domain